MDDHNVHHFWGISPALDLLSVADALGTFEGPASAEPLNILQAASYDSRHTITTLCRLHRHAQLGSRPIHLYVYEEEPEVLMRHILLLSILLDGSLLSKERMETLLEVHSNALLRDKTAEYVDKQGRELERLMMQLATKTCQPIGVSSTANPCSTKQDVTGKQQDQLQSLLASFNLGTARALPASSTPGATNTAPDSTRAASTGTTTTTTTTSSSTYSGMNLLSQLLDISLLRFHDRDRLIEVLQGYRATHPYDMVKAWDTRQRKWYKDRFDARRNMVDWDYHMVLAAAGTPGQEADKGSILHFHHFRHWRMHGIAYELRDACYSQPNRSLLSTAYGRTKEFKDRYGKDVGRSVSAHGYWGDLLNSPYHCWGTQCEEDVYYKFSNKQWARTAVDVAEHNVLALLHELRTGSRYTSGQAPHRARVARGPTSLTDLQEDAEQTSQAEEAAEKLRKETPAGQGGQAGKQLGSIDEGAEEGGEEAGAQQAEEQAHVGGELVVQAGGGEVSGGGSEAGVFQACATFRGPRPGFLFKRGPQGVGYYPDPGSASKGQPQAAPPETAQQLGDTAVPAPAARVDPEQHQGSDAAGDGDVQADGAEAVGVMKAGAGAGVGDKHARLQAEADALRAAEQALDMAAAVRLGGGRVRVIPVLGGGGTTPGAGGQAASDLVKLLTGKSKYAGLFQVLTLGHRHVHLLNPEYKLSQVAAPGAAVVVEGARHLLQLKADQAEVFNTKVGEMASQGGWTQPSAQLQSKLRTAPDGSSAGMTLTPAHLLFVKQA